MIRIKNTFDVKALHYEDLHELFEDNVLVGRELYFSCPLEMVEYNKSDYESYLSDQTYIERFTVRLTVPMFRKASEEMVLAISPTVYMADTDGYGDIDWMEWIDISHSGELCPDWGKELIKLANDQIITALIENMKDGEYAILQLDETVGGEACGMVFRDYDYCKDKIMPYMYRLVYRKQAFVGFEDLDSIYARHNRGLQPYGYYGHSLSVSDLILVKDGYVGAYFVNDFGFQFFSPIDRFLMENMNGYIRIPLVKNKVNLPLEENEEFSSALGTAAIRYFGGTRSFEECLKDLRKENLVRPDATWEMLVTDFKSWLREYPEYY